MNTSKITLTPLTDDDRNRFILDNQYAFKYGACEEFGPRVDHFEDDGEIISRETIEKSIDGGVAYRICDDGEFVGGLVLKIDEETQHNHLDLLFVSPDVHSKGIGFHAVEFFGEFNRDTNEEDCGEGPSEMFRFEKVMK